MNIQTTTKLEPGKEGQDVKLTCKLSGPVEKVQWHKRGGFLVDEKLRYTKYSVDRGKKLHKASFDIVNRRFTEVIAREPLEKVVCLVIEL